MILYYEIPIRCDFILVDPKFGRRCYTRLKCPNEEVEEYETLSAFLSNQGWAEADGEHFCPEHRP